MSKASLRLGRLPDPASTKLTQTLSAGVRSNLDLYAAYFGEVHGQKVEAADLAAHMIATFMAWDRAFKRRASQDRSKGG